MPKHLAMSSSPNEADRPMTDSPPVLALTDRRSPIMRTALYARYSTDRQSPLSIDDQLRLCRGLAASLGAHVVREISDAELSGFSAARPGLAELLDLVRAGAVDLVIAEHSDRLA